MAYQSNTQAYMSHLKSKVKRPFFQKSSYLQRQKREEVVYFASCIYNFYILRININNSKPFLRTKDKIKPLVVTLS